MRILRSTILAIYLSIVAVGSAGVNTKLSLLGPSGTITSVMSESGGSYTSGLPCRMYAYRRDASGNLLWGWYYDTAYGHGPSAAVLTPDGGMAVAGTNGTSSHTQLFLAKYTSTGTLTWIQHYQYSSSQDSLGSDIALDSSGNIYVVGSSQTTTASVGMVVKFNSTGARQWTKTYNPKTRTYFHHCAMNSSDQLFVVGDGWNGSTDSYDQVVARYDTSGTRVWGHLRDYASANDHDRALLLDSSGQPIIVADNDLGGGHTAVIDKLNVSGTSILSNTFATPMIVADAIIDPSANIVLTGSLPGTFGYYIQKLSPSAVPQWTTFYSDNGALSAKSVAAYSTGEYAVTGSGTTDGSPSATRNLTARFSSAGVAINNLYVDGGYSTSGNSVCIDSNDNLYICGPYNVSATGSPYDIRTYVVKVSYAWSWLWYWIYG